MENCLVLKLKGASTNAELPVYTNIVEKDWLKTTVNNQYINLSSVAGGTRYNRFIIEIKYKAAATITAECLFDTKNSYLNAIQRSTGVLDVKASVSTTVNVASSLNTIHTVKVDYKNNKITFDGVEQSFTADLSTSNLTNLYIFANRSFSSNAGMLQIGYVKIINPVDENVYFNGVPALVDGIPCLYDKLSGTVYTDSAGGDLDAFDD
jgi:hypothetical protein